MRTAVGPGLAGSESDSGPHAPLATWDGRPRPSVVRTAGLSSVGFSRLPICHQLELVVGKSTAPMSRLQPTWDLVFRLPHSEHRMNLPVVGNDV